MEEGSGSKDECDGEGRVAHGAGRGREGAGREGSEGRGGEKRLRRIRKEVTASRQGSVSEVANGQKRGRRAKGEDSLLSEGSFNRLLPRPPPAPPPLTFSPSAPPPLTLSLPQPLYNPPSHRLASGDRSSCCCSALLCLSAVVVCRPLSLRPALF
ncbi:hypothetical protein Mp_3g13970 [Marchantia polymorpha subsp. ruderalis]|uniref:Uncharacterized protein n=2 Tax=Marchantia polymorpha TaxID=3197 RepID=A0AAF6B0K3_MARPO|nr:hypothetical protein MARPO_0004s0274 [Marchantia polymorpha]BBN05537.1 hypothetical protein Mp_3g13970 [Marchantia polymorpha subsp. ruderalis]|eukprot:PTQ49047.1 hypothetical protein MARPO_0004s0274 [Marchantia polymorpha]